MNGSIGWIVVLDLMRGWYQIHIVHRKVVKAKFLRVDEANIYQRGTIEAVLISLINDKDLVINPGVSQECVNCGGEFEEFIEAISERDDNCQLVTI